MDVRSSCFSNVIVTKVFTFFCKHNFILLFRFIGFFEISKRFFQSFMILNISFQTNSNAYLNHIPENMEMTENISETVRLSKQISTFQSMVRKYICFQVFSIYLPLKPTYYHWNNKKVSRLDCKEHGIILW